jgi:hypothetical protein
MDHIACHRLGAGKLENRGWIGGLGGLKLRVKCLFMTALRLLSALQQGCSGNSYLHSRT